MTRLDLAFEAWKRHVGRAWLRVAQADEEPMKTSQAGLALICRQEGCVLHVYPDQCGIPTYGVGHRVRPGETVPAIITKEYALAQLAKDVESAEAAVSGDVKVPLSQAQFDALVDFTFNCGGGALEHSSALAKLNAGDYQGAADALVQWDKGEVHGHLVELGVLKARREAERALFLGTAAPAPLPAGVTEDTALQDLLEAVRAERAVNDTPPTLDADELPAAS